MASERSAPEAQTPFRLAPKLCSRRQDMDERQVAKNAVTYNAAVSTCGTGDRAQSGELGLPCGLRPGNNARAATEGCSFLGLHY